MAAKNICQLKSLYPTKSESARKSDGKRNSLWEAIRTPLFLGVKVGVKIPRSNKREPLFCQCYGGPINRLMLIQVISLKTRHIATREDFILIPKIIENI